MLYYLFIYSEMRQWFGVRYHQYAMLAVPNLSTLVARHGGMCEWQEHVLMQNSIGTSARALHLHKWSFLRQQRALVLGCKALLCM